MLFCVLPSSFSNGFSSKRETARSLRISFKGQNIKFTASMLLTCILYCDAGPGYDWLSLKRGTEKGGMGMGNWERGIFKMGNL